MKKFFEEYKSYILKMSKIFFLLILGLIAIILIATGGVNLNYSLGSDDKQGIIVSIILLLIGIPLIYIIDKFLDKNK